MKILLPLVAAMSALVCVACAEDDHEHDVSEFETYDECAEHYAAEGHGDAEVEDFCAALKEGT